jgi:PAS domain S-box-containing protein/putative nucleotidyltransferase with HDIG domain
MDSPSLSDRKRDISSEWLRAIVASALDGVVMMDDKGRIIGFNPAAEKIFGYRKEKTIGRRVSDLLIPRPSRNAHEKGITRFLATGQESISGRRVEVTAMRADGSRFPAELEVISVKPDRSRVFVAYIRDITERKAALRAQQRYAVNIKKTLVQTILAISRMVEIRDPYTAGHQRRVAHLAAAIAQSLQFSEEKVEGVFLGGLIHDIGKIAVPSEILARPGNLREEDAFYLQIHCRKGYEILSPVECPWPVAEIALQHHEHIDGSGYPQGLKGTDILLESRIVCVADVVESLTAHRPYRPAYPMDRALGEISRRAGKWYDIDIVKACIKLFESGYHIDAVDMDELTWISSLAG